VNTATKILSLVLALSVAADGLAAQRRGTGGSNGGRGTASGRGGGVSSGSRRSGGSSGGGGRRSAQPGRGTRSGGSQPSGSGTTSTGTRRTSGKIGEVKGQAGTPRSSGGGVADGGIIVSTCWGCGYWGGWGYPYPYPMPYPHPYPDSYPSSGESEGQGYLDYPFEGHDTTVTFVRSHVRTGRSFGAFSGQYFADQGSTTKAGRFALEGASGMFRGELEYSFYAEPLLTRTDQMHTFRVAAGVQPGMGRKAYVIFTGGLRGVVLDNGRSAFGPEGELGLQTFPQRHLGLNVTGRLAGIVWNGTSGMQPLREVNATGSLFINRVELQAGWHWLRIGDAPAFGGPMLGTRLWF
jgi:hypothetical protein